MILLTAKNCSFFHSAALENVLQFPVRRCIILLFTVKSVNRAVKTMDTTEKTIEKKYVYRGKIINVRCDGALLPNGEPCKREIVEHHGGAAILCVTGGKIAFVKQYRYAYGKEVLEIPAGKLEAGEDPLNAAKRELKEETGVSAEKFEKIAEVYPSPGYTNEIIYIYRAYPVSAGAASPDPDEFLSVLWIGEEDAEKMLKSGEISDAKTIIALQRYFWEKASR